MVGDACLRIRLCVLGYKSDHMIRLSVQFIHAAGDCESASVYNSSVFLSGSPAGKEQALSFFRLRASEYLRFRTFEEGLRVHAIYKALRQLAAFVCDIADLISIFCSPYGFQKIVFPYLSAEVERFEQLALIITYVPSPELKTFFFQFFCARNVLISLRPSVCRDV